MVAFIQNYVETNALYDPADGKLIFTSFFTFEEMHKLLVDKLRVNVSISCMKTYFHK